MFDYALGHMHNFGAGAGGRADGGNGSLVGK